MYAIAPKDHSRDGSCPVSQITPPRFHLGRNISAVEQIRIDRDPLMTTVCENPGSARRRCSIAIAFTSSTGSLRSRMPPVQLPLPDFRIISRFFLSQTGHAHVSFASIHRLRAHELDGGLQCSRDSWQQIERLFGHGSCVKKLTDSPLRSIRVIGRLWNVRV